MADPTTRLPASPTSSVSVSRSSTASTAVPTPTTQSVDIASVMERYGWQPGDWQERLLQSADDAGQDDGKISASELDGYLAAPVDGQFLTSSRLVEARNVIKTAGTSVAVDSFAEGWQRNLAQAADQLGYSDGKVSEKDMEKYIAHVRNEKGALPTWFPEQKAAAFHSKVAELTGEADSLSVEGDGRPVSPQGAKVTDSPTGVQIIKDYMRISVDADTRNPEWVSYVMSGADLQISESPPRHKGGFHLDPDMPKLPVPRVSNGEYTLLNKARATDTVATPFDRGHMREAESSVNVESMYESFQTNNISPQYGTLNQGAWRYLEEATRELAESNQGKVTVVTGNLYLDANGKPLPADQIDMQATTLGHKGLGIPTHCFKTVLLEKDNGERQMFAFIVPNNPDMKRDLQDVQSRLGPEGWRVSVDQVEQLLGADLYAHLDPATQERLEKDPAARAAMVSQTEFKMANLFMGDGTYQLAAS